MNRKDKKMNIESGPSPEAMAEFKAPPEGFEVKEPPAIPDGGKEYKSEAAEPQGDNVFKHEITDKNGNIIYKRESSGTEKQGEPGSDWQKFSEYDNQGRVTKEISQKPMPGKEAQSTHEYTYGKNVDDITINASIEAGVDKGRQWKTWNSDVVEMGGGRKIIVEETKIEKAGENPQQQDKNAIYTKTKFFQNGKWLGEKVHHQGGPKDGQTTEQLATGVKELPKWQ